MQDYRVGGANFVRCTVHDARNRSFFSFPAGGCWDCQAVPAGHPPPTTDNCAGVADVVGMDFRVVNTFGCTVDQDSRPVRTALKASNVSIRAADCQKR